MSYFDVISVVPLSFAFKLTLASHVSSPVLFVSPPCKRTHVAGTACGVKFGVATNCKLCSLKAIGKNGKSDTRKVIQALNYIVEQCKAPDSLCVANLSLSGGRDDDYNKAVADAVNAGVVVVAAAGNKSRDACLAPPASEALAITVGSITEFDDEPSWYSNWGKCVGIWAPGSDIKSAGISSSTAYALKSGTSMAAPRE